MTVLFEELDYRVTPIGALGLRRRRDLMRDIDVYEIKLGDEFLMTSLFTESEIELARLGLAALRERKNIHVVVGGLGLGYTAQAVLEGDAVASLTVIEHLEAVIDWHRDGVLPLGDLLARDPRCRFVHDDFFACAAEPAGAFGETPADAILVDIDHAPDKLLSEANAGFYTRDGLARLSEHLTEGGVFGLWSNDPPDTAFTDLLASLYDDVKAHVVSFENSNRDGDAACTVYVARKRSD